MPITLKTALQHAKNAAERTGAEAGLGLVTIDPEGIRAQGLTVGVFIPFATGFDREFQVDATIAYKMVTKAGPKAALGRRGRSVIIESPKGTFSLTTTTKHTWKRPQPPARWRPLPEADAHALRVVSALSSKSKGDPMATTRLTPTMALARQYRTVAVAYVNPVAASLTVARELLLKCPAGKLGVRDNRVFIEDADGVVHWARASGDPYPESRIYTSIANARSRREHAAVFDLDIRSVLPLVERAAAACRVPADSGWLVVEDDNASITLRSDLGGYMGAVPVVGERTTERRRVGIRPVELLRFLKALKGIDTLSCCVDGERTPLHIWTTAAPALEVLLESAFVTDAG